MNTKAEKLKISHQPVLLSETLEALNIEENGIYVDATFGRGGHSQAILKRLGKLGKLIAIDRDPEAVKFARIQFANDPRFSIYHQGFAEIADAVKSENSVGHISGIFFDLGVSSPQLDTPERGFSFRQDGPLDMRMDPTQKLSAAEWILQVKERELAQILKEYGEERYAKRIARAIIAARHLEHITRTQQLAEIIAKAHPQWEPHKHPATRSFQAIRIYLNEELTQLKTALTLSVELLKVGGRIAVISFHSLEDRMTKKFLQKAASGDVPRGIPLLEKQITRKIKIIGRAIKPSATEVTDNPRARSAILRIGEKIA